MMEKIVKDIIFGLVLWFLSNLWFLYNFGLKGEMAFIAGQFVMYFLTIGLFFPQKTHKK